MSRGARHPETEEKSDSAHFDQCNESSRKYDRLP